MATVGNAQRDPRSWSLSSIYLALLAADTELQGDDLGWFDLSAVLAEEFALAFDHAQLVAQAYERLSAKAVYTSAVIFAGAAIYRDQRISQFSGVLGLGGAAHHLAWPLEKIKQQGWGRDTGAKNYPRMGRPQHLLEQQASGAGLFVFDRSALS